MLNFCMYVFIHIDWHLLIQALGFSKYKETNYETFVYPCLDYETNYEIENHYIQISWNIKDSSDLYKLVLCQINQIIT